jgi:structure-specific recognition protein 1
LRDDEIDITLNISEETIEKKYEGKLKKTYSAPTFDVVSNVFKSLTERNITVPGTFRSRSNAPAVKCAIKANDGYLYPLEKAFFFITKPTIYIRHADIASLEFGRYQSDIASGASSRSFDLKFHTKGGVEYQFSNIAREEYQNIYDFIIDKKLNILNIVSDKRRYQEDFEEDEESDLDADMDADVGDKNEDEESEADEDYRPPSADEELAEEFDEDYSSPESGGDSEGDVIEKDSKEQSSKNMIEDRSVTRKSKTKSTNNMPKQHPLASVFDSQKARSHAAEENSEELS